MGLLNQSLYDRNATRDYPLADSATATSTAGLRLPTEIIADLNLRYPSTLGYYPFIAAVTVTSNVLSVVLQCATDPGDATTFVPLAAVTVLVGDLVPGRQYALSAMAPGVGGWLVFGRDAAVTLFQGRFSSPLAGLLAPRAARPYRPLPVQSIGQLNTAQPLQGIVQLQASSPLTLAADTRVIDGVTRQVAVLSLVQPIGGAASILSSFTGPCGARPESGNCPQGDAIEVINNVPADCNGNITIELNGCARIARVAQACGIVIDCALGLVSACLPKNIPAPDGQLSNEYDNQCTSDVSETLSPPLCLPLKAGHSYQYSVSGTLTSGSCKFDSNGNVISGSECVKFGGNSATQFDCPTQPFASLVGQYGCAVGTATCTGCGTFSFITGNRQEWIMGGPAEAVLYSDVAVICVDGVESISFDADSDDWVAMIGATDEVVESVIGPTTAQTFELSTNYIFFNNTVGHTNSSADHTVQKTWTYSGGSGIDPTGHSFTYERGDLTGSAGSVNWLTRGGFTVQSWLTPVPVATLREFGWIDANNILRFRMFHVPGGNGFASVRSVTCNRAVDNNTCFKLGSAGTLAPTVDTSLSVIINGVAAIPSSGTYTLTWTDLTDSVTSTYELDAGGGSTPPGLGDGNGISTVSESLGWDGTLPYNETFDVSLGHFKVVMGHFVLVSDDSPDDPGPTHKSLSSETDRSAAQRNVALWSGFDHTTIGRKYTTAIKLLAGTGDTNAGMVINWRPNGDFSGRWVYYVAQLDYVKQQFAILYFNGSQLIATTAVAQLTNLQPGRWYKIEVTTTAAGGGSVTLTAVLSGLGGFTLDATLSLTTANFYPDTGQVGVVANRSKSRFAYFTVTSA